MMTYRYLNKDHTLALRDQHVIVWDPQADAPTGHLEGPDEMKLWVDAGSPKPDEYRPSLGGNNEESPTLSERLEYFANIDLPNVVRPPMRSENAPLQQATPRSIDLRSLAEEIDILKQRIATLEKDRS